MLTRSSAASRSSPIGNEDLDKRRRSTITNDDDQQQTDNCASSSSSQAKPLKKRWLANHHVDQEQQLNPSNLSIIHSLIREYNFQDWQTIPVLVRIGNCTTNEYINGTIVDIPKNASFIVVPTMSQKNIFPNQIEIDLFENLFGILSDNAPPIRELIEGKHVLCRRQRMDLTTNYKYSIYQSGIILEKTSDAKFRISLDNQSEIVSLPRQSIRLFLPPWHDGLFKSIFNLSFLFISSPRNSF